MEVAVLYTKDGSGNVTVRGVYDDEQAARSDGLNYAAQTQCDFFVVPKQVLSKEGAENERLLAWKECVNSAAAGLNQQMHDIIYALDSCEEQSFETKEEWNNRLRRAVLDMSGVDFDSMVANIREIRTATQAERDSI